MRYHTKNGIHTVRRKDLAAFLQKRLDALQESHNTLPYQMEFYFEGLNWWWYDDEGHLHPNDSDYSWHSEPEFNYSDYDDDVPF